jgi:AcrR family transcriptional regulator
MSPRPQKVSDDELFAAAYRVMQRVPPSGMTLGAIAAEAGVTAGLLVQRFGSRRALMVRLAEAAADSASGFVGQLRATHPSPLAALRAYAGCMAEMAPDADAMVRSLAYLTEDLGDPELRTHLERQARETRRSLERLVRDAVEAGELDAATKPASLVRTIEAVIPGSMLTWATYREGRAAAWIRRDLDRVLMPYLAGGQAR